MALSEDALSELLGKTVAGLVLTANNENDPRSQLYLVFSDGTSFEFWADSDYISAAKGMDQYGMDRLIDIQKSRPGANLTIVRPMHEEPDAPQRDLLV
jgi:hypothetical protein